MLGEKKQQLAEEFAFDFRIKNDPNFIEMWLSLAQEVKDPEELFVYMFQHDIGVRYLQFYKRWIDHYIDNRAFAFVYQLTQIVADRFEAQMSNNQSKRSRLILNWSLEAPRRE